MGWPGFQFRIRGIMAVVAVVALVCASQQPVLSGLVASVLAGFAGLAVGLARWRGMTRLRAAAWVATAYPWFCLAAVYLAWVVAWITLGRRPWPSRDDPKEIGAAVLLVYVPAFVMLAGAGFAAIADFFLIAAEIMATMGRGGRGERVEVAGLVLLPFLSWGSVFLILAVDVGHVFDWFMD